MKPPRSVLPLPRYVLRKPIRGAWAYFFNPPMWARKAGCPLKSEPLGRDYDKAVERAECILLPAFDSWLRGDGQQPASVGAEFGTLDWIFAEYRADRRYTTLDARTRRNHESGFKLVGSHILKNGIRLGSVRLTAINTALIDALYEKLLVLRVKDADGNEVERERRTTVNHAMKSCRRAWNVAARRNPGKLPSVNPFSAMGLVASNRETPTANFAELQAFRVKAIDMGFPSLATPALIGWEWLQRETDIFATFEVGHYRPKERPNSVRVLHEKTQEENWIPLLNERTGAPAYPELMAELDAIKKTRIAGLMLRRDWGKQDPWPTWPREDIVELSLMRHRVKEIIGAAGLRDELTFTSFGHGGFTEAADSDLTDAEMRAQGRHKSAKVLPRYAKRTMRQVEEGCPQAQGEERTIGGHLSEWSSSRLSE